MSTTNVLTTPANYPEMTGYVVVVPNKSSRCQRDEDSRDKSIDTLPLQAPNLVDT